MSNRLMMAISVVLFNPSLAADRFQRVLKALHGADKRGPAV